MTSDYEPGAVRFEGGRPVAVGEQELAQPTQMIRTPAGGTWALHAVGEEVVVVHPGGAVRGPAVEVAGWLRAAAGGRGGSDDDRQAASSLLAFVAGGDDPGTAEDVPRSIAGGEVDLPRSYPLSGPTNSPAGHTGSASGRDDPYSPPA